MKKNSRILTLVAAAWAAWALAVPPPEAAAAERRADPTRLDPHYRPQHDTDRPAQGEAGQAGGRANYHADYHVRTGSEPSSPQADDMRDTRARRQEWSLWPDPSGRTPGWRR